MPAHRLTAHPNVTPGELITVSKNTPTEATTDCPEHPGTRLIDGSCTNCAWHDQRHRIERGQEYERHDPHEGVITRIRVLSQPTRDFRGGSAVRVATLTADGREIRQRWTSTSNLHADPARRTGYRLVRGADGTEAEGAQ